MAWGLLMFVILVIITSVSVIARDMASIPSPAAPLPLGENISAGQQFILYRNAVIAYVVSNNSIARGTAPLSALQPYLAHNRLGTLPTTAQNVIVQNGTNITVCVWMPAPAGTFSQLEKQLGNDMTIGLVNHTTNWSQAGPDGVTSPIPEECLGASQPAPGDIFSVVEIGT